MPPTQTLEVQQLAKTGAFRLAVARMIGPATSKLTPDEWETLALVAYTATPGDVHESVRATAVYFARRTAAKLATTDQPLHYV